MQGAARDAKDFRRDAVALPEKCPAKFIGA